MNDYRDDYFEKEETFDIIRELKYFLGFWPWYVGSALIFLSISFFYIRYQDNIYKTSSSILIEETTSDPSSFMTGGVDDLLFSSDLKIENEIALITSNSLIAKVVDSLKLEQIVFRKGKMKNKLLFGQEIPFQTAFYTQKNLEIEVVIENDYFTIFYPKNNEIESRKLPLSETFSNTDFKIFIDTEKPLKKGAFIITTISKENAINRLRNNLTLNRYGNTNDIIELVFTGPNINRNQRIIDVLIEKLKRDKVYDKREIFEISIRFINNRLELLTKSLDTMNIETIAFKSDNSFFSSEVQTQNALAEIQRGEDEILRLNIQVEVAKSLIQNISQSDNNTLLPANVGIDNTQVLEGVGAYNQKLLEKKKLQISSTNRSPAITIVQSELNTLKESIIQSLNVYTDNLSKIIESYNNVRRESESEIASLPEKELLLRGYSRNYEIVEQLYVYLLQKKEEASISYVTALPNIKVMNYTTTTGPISPQSSIIYAFSFVLGIIFPVGFFVMRRLLDTKFNSREDLEIVLPNIPIIGEVPFEANHTKTYNPRSMVSETLRVVRINLMYLLNNKKEGNVLLVTSSFKGEGKTFIAYNLAKTYAALNKKVLLIGGDLRNPKIHEILGMKRKGINGLSNLLIDNTDNIDDYKNYIISNNQDSEIDLLFSGPIPPNPSELLMQDKMELLIQKFKKDYDYVIIDSAPLMIIGDTNAYLKLVDGIVYLIRANHTEKKVKNFILDMVRSKNVKNLGLLINGVGQKKDSYYKYNYGYGYGYTSERRN